MYAACDVVYSIVFADARFSIHIRGWRLWRCCQAEGFNYLFFVWFHRNSIKQCQEPVWLDKKNRDGDSLQTERKVILIHRSSFTRISIGERYWIARPHRDPLRQIAKILIRSSLTLPSFTVTVTAKPQSFHSGKRPDHGGDGCRAPVAVPRA